MCLDAKIKFASDLLDKQGLQYQSSTNVYLNHEEMVKYVSRANDRNKKDKVLFVGILTLNPYYLQALLQHGMGSNNDYYDLYTSFNGVLKDNVHSMETGTFATSHGGYDLSARQYEVIFDDLKMLQVDTREGNVSNLDTFSILDASNTVGQHPIKDLLTAFGGGSFQADVYPVSFQGALIDFN